MGRQSAAILRISLGILILFAVGALAFLIFFPADQIADRVAARLEAQTGRPVAIEHVGLAVGMVPRLTFHGVTLGRTGKADDPVRSVRVEELDLTVRLMPLLRRDVQVRELLIKQPVVSIVQVRQAADETRLPGSGGPATEGSPDSSFVTSPGAAETGDGTPGGMSVSVEIDHLRIEDARIEVFDPAISDSLPAILLNGLDERLSATLSSAAILVLEGTTTIQEVAIRTPAGTLGQGLEARIEKTLRYNIENDRLDIETATLTAGGIAVGAHGSISGLASGQSSFAFDFKADPTQAETILAFIPKEMLAAAEGVESRGIVAAVGSVSRAKGSKEIDYNVTIDLSEGRVVHPQLPRPIDDLVLTAQVEPERVEIRNGRLKTGRSDLQFHVVITEPLAARDLQVGLRGTIDLEEMAALQPEPTDVNVSGTADVELALTGVLPSQDAPTLEELQPVGTMTLREVTVTGPSLVAPVTDLAGQVGIRGAQLTTSELRGKLGRSDFNARGRVDNFMALRPEVTEIAVLDLTVESSFLDLDELLPQPNQAGGRAAQGGAAGGASGPTVAPGSGLEILQRLEGSIEMQSSRVLFKETEGTGARGRLALDRGVVGMQNVALRALGGDVRLHGAVDLRQPRQPIFDLGVQVAGARAAEVFAKGSTFDRLNRLGGHLTGTVDLTADFKGALDDTAGIDWNRFTSKGTLEMSGVEMAGLPLQTRLASYLEAPLEPLHIRDWLQPFHVEDGKLFVDKLSVNAGGLDVTGGGWQRIDGALSYTFQLFLPQEMSQGVRSKIPAELVPALFDGSGKRVVLPVQISGTWKEPKVTVDTSQLTAQARQRAEEKLQAERDRVQKEVEDRAQDVIGDLKGKYLPQPKAPADSSRGATDTKVVEKEVKDLLKGILGGRK